MADMIGSGEEANEGNRHAHAEARKAVVTQYFTTARTAPRAPHESRIGTDEAHERLQAARNNARRDTVRISPE